MSVNPDAEARVRAVSLMSCNPIVGEELADPEPRSEIVNATGDSMSILSDTDSLVCQIFSDCIPCLQEGCVWSAGGCLAECSDNATEAPCWDSGLRFEDDSIADICSTATEVDTIMDDPFGSGPAAIEAFENSAAAASTRTTQTLIMGAFTFLVGFAML